MKRIVLLLASFILVIVRSSANKYVVSNQKVTFHEGYLRCLQYGLEPAEILSESDEEEIETVLKPLREIFEDLVGFGEGFWIFASNLVNKTNYYWLNSKLPLFYSLFSTGQPDNADQKENCLEIYQISTGVFGWNDCPCESKIKFICQRKKRDISSCNETNMESNVIAKSSVNRYVVSNQRVTFHEGYIRCLQYGLEPAEILSESDEKEIEAALEPLREIQATKPPAGNRERSSGIKADAIIYSALLFDQPTSFS
ncbi:hypothetical protein GWI33_003298 [Rhynchophorus ferrugineus]|uniref:C-type lectin domain-containing protein n=1 Tax=Rhynchophorus ferrugineus TaxID=354439 RepID=A0A834HX95_RHYFE|nr:hypothetical protein GWI33_003298 [Rhynchophorus ferrugineus]